MSGRIEVPDKVVAFLRDLMDVCAKHGGGWSVGGYEYESSIDWDDDVCGEGDLTSLDGISATTHGKYRVEEDGRRVSATVRVFRDRARPPTDEWLPTEFSDEDDY